VRHGARRVRRRDFLERAVGRMSRNDYFAVENREGVRMPSALQTARAGA
jgi:hypothetical protein